ncbi:MAG: electron transport complex subunit RsxC [Candidatus Cloacimonetes bacterium 4572_65]|nr:MAG: electron transport complex subunit RsxC [Candidatus Cloacimonetes bacterium 4572_65]
MKLKTFPGGAHPHDFKEFSKDASIETFPLPKKVVIPLAQHIGAPSKPIVKVGDLVKTGQMISEAGGFVSIPMHASITGKVTKIAKFPHPVGTSQMAIEITGDGEKDDWIELVEEKNYSSLSVDEMKKRISEAGVCGMGGAGFPTHVKLSPPKEKPIDTVILNGVECEPFLTADYRIMLERAEDIISGLKLLMKIVGATKGIIGIEANKPDAMAHMEKLVASENNIEVIGLKVMYPQGAEKQLIYATTKRKVPSNGGLPMDIKVVVQNVGTAIAVYEAVSQKRPLIERVITITGAIVKNPKNYSARIGTLYSELLEGAGGVTEDIGSVISGGPMMGFAIPTLETPMTKGSSGLLIFNKKQAKRAKEQTCISCASCVDVCPMNLIPNMIVRGAKYGDWDLAIKAGGVDCMKCGTCAYVCPANINIIQYADIAKAKIWELKQKK